MLATLKRIVQEVNGAGDLSETLSIIVTRVKQAMNVDVCSVYLLDIVADAYVLMATDGLNPEAVGSVSLARGEGLVSVVGRPRKRSTSTMLRCTHATTSSPRPAKAITMASSAYRSSTTAA